MNLIIKFGSSSVKRIIGCTQCQVSKNILSQTNIDVLNVEMTIVQLPEISAKYVS